MKKGVTIFSYSLSFVGIFYILVNDIVDQKTLAYNGNQLNLVNDYGLPPNQYGVKEYQNKSNADDEFAYDKIFRSLYSGYQI